MKKQSMLMMVAALVMLASCGNEPTAPSADSTYLPQLAEDIVGSSATAAKEKMEKEAFTLVESDNGWNVYKKSYTDAKKNTGTWKVQYEVSDNNVEYVTALQEILDKSTVATTATAWGKFIGERQSNFSLWFGAINKNGETTTYIDGSMTESLRNMINVATSLGIDDPELLGELEAMKQMLNNNRTNYFADLKNVDFSAEGTGCAETYVTINSLRNMTGQINSYMQGSLNDFESDDGEAGVVDVEYAQKTYDSFQEKNSCDIPVNNNDIITYEDGEVSANWGNNDDNISQHELMMKYGKNAGKILSFFQYPLQ